MSGTSLINFMPLSRLSSLGILAVLSFIHFENRNTLYELRPHAPYNVKDNTGCAIQNYLRTVGGTTLLNMAIQQPFFYISNGTHSQFMGYTAYNCSNTTHYKSIAVDLLFFSEVYLLPGLTFTALYQVVYLPKVIFGMKFLSYFNVIIAKLALYLQTITLNHFSPGQENDNPSLPDTEDAAIVICKIFNIPILNGNFQRVVCNLLGSVTSDVIWHYTFSPNHTNKAIVKSAHQSIEDIFVARYGNPLGHFLWGWTRKPTYDLILPIINKLDWRLRLFPQISTPDGQISGPNRTLIDSIDHYNQSQEALDLLHTLLLIELSNRDPYESDNETPKVLDYTPLVPELFLFHRRPYESDPDLVAAQLLNFDVSKLTGNSSTIITF